MVKSTVGADEIGRVTIVPVVAGEAAPVTTVPLVAIETELAALDVPIGFASQPPESIRSTVAAPVTLVTGPAAMPVATTHHHVNDQQNSAHRGLKAQPGAPVPEAVVPADVAVMMSFGSGCHTNTSLQISSCHADKS